MLASLRKVTNSSLLYSKKKIILPSILPALSPPHYCPLPHTEDGDQPLATERHRGIGMWCSLLSCHMLPCFARVHPTCPTGLGTGEPAVAAWSQQDMTMTLGLYVPRTPRPGATA